MARMAGWRNLARTMVMLGMAASAIAVTATGQEARSDEEPRQRGWSLLASVAGVDGVSAVSGWYNEADLFGRGEAGRSMRRPVFPGLPIGAAGTMEQRLRHVADAPVITFVHYDPEAYGYVRGHRLHQAERLAELMQNGASDPVYPHMLAIPPLPRGARVLMSAWWPVGAGSVTPLPVWDPREVARPGGSNDYTSWRRVVAVDAGAAAGRAAPVTFAGRTFVTARRVALNRFIHLPVGRRLAAHLMEDAGARKAALIALGRPLRTGDSLVLVAFHLMAADAGMGVWATAWWHDRPDEGVFAADRPATIRGRWRHYLMDVAVDPVLPLEPDGSPHICFNPWFEAKFPDGGQGSGLKSNCINCHERASYPLTEFLPVRRGTSDASGDPAFAPGRLRTARLWALANPPREAP